MNGNGHDPAKMWAHSNHVKKVVANVMLDRPQTVGDYRLLVFEVWKHYGVGYRYDRRTGEVFLKFRTWEHQRQIPSANTIIRRAQELKEWDRLREAMGMPKLFSRTLKTEMKGLMLEGMYHDYYGEIGHQVRLMEAMG